MAPPFARNSDEAHLYMQLHPCVCGSADVDVSSSVAETPAGWMVRYAGACVDCGRERTFEFRQPEELSMPPENAWAAGDEPSELLDAGEWLWVADSYGSVPAEPSEELSEVRRRHLRTDLMAALAAVDEVLKFLPDDAAEVPDEAFWSERGRRMRVAEPGRFQRFRLAAARQTYQRAVDDLAP
ncbi:hypothetical protein [Plantactinospora sp. GCM10030261]|uniref:hypothetical protein n=1 Tax=Plantactinospora sp. GCM10030261 TaxID=3273420 RepID=UPI0036161CC0